jgi:hypothetical protein
MMEGFQTHRNCQNTHASSLTHHLISSIAERLSLNPKITPKNIPLLLLLQTERKSIIDPTFKAGSPPQHPPPPSP